MNKIHSSLYEGKNELLKDMRYFNGFSRKVGEPRLEITAR